MNEPKNDNRDERAFDADPRLDALLDEALAADELPAGLNDRIVSATAARLPGAVVSGAVLPGVLPGAGAVIGRIGGGLRWRGLAAAVLLSVVVGGWWLVDRGSSPGNSTAPGQTIAVADPLAPAELGEVFDQLARAEREAEAIDDRIDLLSMQVAWAQTPGIWAADALDSLDAAITRDEFELLADDLEMYF